MSQTQTIPDRVIFFILLWLSIVAFPRFPSNELDASWGMVLSYAFTQNLQFGKEIIFTYGPLGFLMGRTYVGIHFYSHIIWQFLSAAVFAWVIVRSAGRLNPMTRFFYYFYFLLLATLFDDAFHRIIILLIGWDLLRETPHNEHSFPAMAQSGVLAIFSLVKFTDLLSSVIALICYFVYALLRAHYRRALLVVASYGVVFVTIWAAVGQNPVNIPAYISNSLEITRGYNEGLNWEQTASIFTLGLATVLFLVLYSILYYVTHPDKIKSAFLISLFGASLYLQWKHGFVQPNPFHLVGFFAFGLFPLMAIRSSVEDSVRAQKGKNLLLIIAGMTAVIGIYLAMPQLVLTALPAWPHRVIDNLQSIVGLTRLHGTYEERWKKTQSSFGMPRVKREVGSASVDVLGNQQGIALFNDLHYTPRPIFQSHSVHTPKLIQGNVKFFKSKSAPEYVLQKYQTIDNRFPSLDDARVLNLLLEKYKFLFAEKGYLLWKKKVDSERNSSRSPKLYREEKVRFNERIELNELWQSNVWVEMKYEPSLVGMIRALLYKPPAVMITVFDGDAILGSFNLVRPMAEDGFMLNPLIENHFDLLRFIGGHAEKRITSFSLDIDASDQKFYRMPLQLRLYSLPAFPSSEVSDSNFHSAVLAIDSRQ